MEGDELEKVAVLVLSYLQCILTTYLLTCLLLTTILNSRLIQVTHQNYTSRTGLRIHVLSYLQYTHYLLLYSTHDSYKSPISHSPKLPLEQVAVLARPTAGIKLGLTLTDLGRGQVCVLALVRVRVRVRVVGLGLGLGLGF